ncbi:hypothetical protein EDB83DRAFT_2235405, partial [Lactarius deliciosus]
LNPGELKLTFMRSSIREANLKALLEDDSEVRSRVGDLVEVYKGILAKDARGTRLAHMIDVVHLTQKTADIAYDGNSLYESSLPDAILAAFRQFLHCKYPGLREEDATEGSSTPVASPEAKVLDRFSLHGVQYSTASRRACDSHVFFQSPHTGSEMSKPEPGQITCYDFTSLSHFVFIVLLRCDPVRYAFRLLACTYRMTVPTPRGATSRTSDWPGYG